MIRTALNLFVALCMIKPDLFDAQVVPYATPQLIPNNKTACLIAHNAKRALHCVPDLQWDDSLVPGAEAWALYHARKPQVGMEHSKGNGGKFRENIYYKFVHPVGTVATWEDAVKWWYDEIRFYDYKNPGYNLPAAHFTQLIWKKSTKVGGAMSAHTRGQHTYTFVVAHYAPAGNVKGTFAYNVPDLQCKTAKIPYLKPQNIKVQTGDCLNAHNAKRNLHGAHNLQWDRKLAQDAAAWALNLAKSSALKARSSPRNGQGFRENTYYRYDSPPGKVSTCRATVQSWYNEKRYYDFKRPGFKPKAAHFTQLIWKKTRKVGVGMAAVTLKGSKTYTFIVARYSPPGNLYGIYSANVKDLRSKGKCRVCPTDAVPYSSPKITVFNSANCLKTINGKRSLHGVPNLQWDASMARNAAKWALKLAKLFKNSNKVKMRTSPRNGKTYRESSYWMNASIGKLGTCANAVKFWYGQKAHYKFKRPGFRFRSQHFTQLIWKSSTRVGVGIAVITKSGLTYSFIVARFSPPGNIYRQFAKNVFKQI